MQPAAYIRGDAPVTADARPRNVANTREEKADRPAGYHGIGITLRATNRAVEVALPVRIGLRIARTARGTLVSVPGPSRGTDICLLTGGEIDPRIEARRSLPGVKEK